MRIYLLSGGLLDADRSVIHPGDDSHRRVTLPVMQVLIQRDGHSILVDTGLPPAVANDNSALQREFGIDAAWISSRASPDERVDKQLEMLGLSIADLDLVVGTHFHFDHAGGNTLMAGVPIAAQEAEIVAARESDSYLPVWDGDDLQFRVVHGDWSPMPGVEMLHTPGHTPGHQSMLVRLQGKPWLFTWDAVYTEEHWRQHQLGAVKDIAAARASIDRLRSIVERENARIIFGHDIGQWGSLGMGDGRPRLVAEDGE